MALFWGPELRMLYNASYAAVIGSKHPGALGEPCSEVFPENWETTTGPLFRSVVDSRKPIMVTDMGVTLIRRGFLEQSYYDVSFQPIMQPDGTVGGVLHVVTETTARVLSERRLRLLAALGSRTAGLLTPQDVARTVAEVLDGHREDVPFTAVYLAPGPGRLRLSAATAVAADAAGPAEDLRLEEPAEEGGLAARLAAVVEGAAPAWLPGSLLGWPGRSAGPSAAPLGRGGGRTRHGGQPQAARQRLLPGLLRCARPRCERGAGGGAHPAGAPSARGGAGRAGPRQDDVLRQRQP
ncbi:PAS domain-containing protein [Streptomyces sp. FXJ1.4098]|nr:PAS domain-containing protein [Streptomyces sp. FXJ1.4098]